MTSIYLGTNSGSYSPSGDVTIYVSEKNYTPCNLFKKYTHKLQTPKSGWIYLYKGSTYFTTLFRSYARLQTGTEYQTSKLESVDVYVNRFDSTDNKLLIVFYFKNEGGSTVENKYYPYSELEQLINNNSNMGISSLYKYKDGDGDKQLLEHLIKENDKINQSLTYELDLTGNIGVEKYYRDKFNVSSKEQLKGSQANSFEFYKQVHRPKNSNFQKSFVLYKKNSPMKTDNSYFNEIQGQNYTSASAYYSLTSKDPLMVEFESGSKITQLRRKMSNNDELQWFKSVRPSSYSSNQLIEILKTIESGIKIHVCIEKQQKYDTNKNGSTTPKNGIPDTNSSSIALLSDDLRVTGLKSKGYKSYQHIIDRNSIKLPEISEEEKEHVSIELILKISSVDMAVYDNKGEHKEQLYCTSDRLSYGGNFRVYFYDHSSSTGQPDTVPLMIHHDRKFYGPKEAGSYFMGWNRISNISGINDKTNIIQELDKINKKLNKIILAKTGGQNCKYGLPDEQKSQLNSFKTERVIVKSEPISTTSSTVSPGQTCNKITTNSCKDSVYTKYIHSTVNKFQLGDIEYRDVEISILDENGNQPRNGKTIEVKPEQNQLTVYYLTEDKSCEYPLLIGIGKQEESKPTEQGKVDEVYKMVSNGSRYKWQKEKESGGLTGGSDNSKLVELLDKINYEVKKVVQIQLDKRDGYDLNLSKDIGRSESFVKKDKGHIEVKACQCNGYTELAKFGYKCFHHKLGNALNKGHNQVGGLVFTLPGAENRGSSNSQIKLNNGQSDSGEIQRLYFNKCMGDIYVYFYGYDPRPLLLCYNKEVYRATSKNDYDSQQWVKVDSLKLEKCLCENGVDGDTSGQNEPLLKAVTEVVGFLNTVNLYNHPNGTSTSKGQTCTTGDMAPATTQCQPGTDTSTCTYPVHTYNGKPIKVQVECCPVNGKTGQSCYRKLTHTPIGMNGTGGPANGSGFRLGDVVYKTDKCKIDYYGNGTDSKAKGLTAKNKWAPLLSVSVYYYNEDKGYCDPLLVVLEFAKVNGGTDNGTEKECYKLTSSNGKNLTWAKDGTAKSLVGGDNGELVKHLDAIRYCLKYTIRIHLECKTKYELKGRNGSQGTGGFDQTINGQSSGNGQVKVEVCEVACPALTGSNYKCFRHDLTTALSGKHDQVAGLAFTLPCDKSGGAGQNTCCVNGSTGQNGFVEIPVCVAGQGEATKTGCPAASPGDAICPAVTPGTATCPPKPGTSVPCSPGQTATEIPRILYNSCMGDVCVYFYACKNGGTESCGVSTDTTVSRSCSPKNNGKNGDTVPLMLRYNGQFYAPCDRDNYFTKWVCVSALAGVTGKSGCKCCCGANADGGADCTTTHGTRCTDGCKDDCPCCKELVNKLNEVNEALNRIDLDPGKAKIANWSKGYGLPKECQKGLRGCKLDNTVGNERIIFKYQTVPKQQCTRNGNGVYTRVIHRTKNWFRIGLLTYEGKEITQGITPNGAQNGLVNGAGTKIEISNGSTGNNNHKEQISTCGWNTVVAYYSCSDTGKNLPQLIVILKTDTEVTNGNPVKVSGDKYGYYVLATKSGSSVSSNGSGYQYQYKWVEVNGGKSSTTSVTLDEKTDFSLLNAAIILLELTGTGGSGTYGETEISKAVKSSKLTSPGNPGDVNRLKNRDITVKDETTSTHTCLNNTGFKLMTHYLKELVELSGFKKLGDITLITGLKFLIPTSDEGKYSQVKLCSESTGTNCSKEDRHYHKSGSNIRVFFYGNDPRPLLLCYGEQVYRANSKEDYDKQEWTKDTAAGECKCAQQPPGQCKLVDSLVKVSDFLNPVKLNEISKCSGKDYVVYTFNGKNIVIEVKNDRRSKEFCYDKYTHKHFGVGCGGEGFRLGDIYHGDKCIKLNGSSSNTDSNSKCISASDIDNKDNKHRASSEVVVYYYRGDTKNEHPLLVALKTPDNGSSGNYKPYFELEKKFGAGEQKKYKKNDNGDGLDLRDTNPNGQLAKKLDSILFTISTKLRVVLSQRPQPAKYSPVTEKQCTHEEAKKALKDAVKQGTGNEVYEKVKYLVTCKYKVLEKMAESAEADPTRKSQDPVAFRASLMHHVLRETKYEGKLSNGQPTTPSTETTTITVTEIDCPEIHSQGGYRCFCHVLTEAKNIEQVGGLKLAVFDGPGGAGTPEITLCNGQATSNGKNGQTCKNGGSTDLKPVEISYTTCKGDLYVFFYGDDPRPLMLCYDGHAYRPTSLETYCRQWVRLNNGGSVGKNGTAVNCLCDTKQSGAPKFNSKELLNALYRVSVFMNPVKLCLSQQAIEDMSHKREDQSDPPTPAKREYTYLAHAYPPEHIQVRIVPQDLNCYRVYTHQPVKHGFRLGRVTYAEANEGDAANTQGQTCSQSTASTAGQTCSQGTPGATSTSTDQTFCFAYDYTKQLLTVSTYYYMYDIGHNWPLVVELGFRGQGSEFFRLCSKPDSGSNGAQGNGSGGGNGAPGANGDAQGTNGCKAPTGLKWVRMTNTTHTTGSPIPNSSCCPDGPTTQNSGSNGQCQPCNTGDQNGNSQDEKAETCRLDREFVEEAERLQTAIYSAQSPPSVFTGDRVPMERELTDLVERRAYQVRTQLDIKYDKDDKNLILATASNCWEGWPLDYMVGGGVLGVAGGGGWKIAVAVLGLVVKL